MKLFIKNFKLNHNSRLELRAEYPWNEIASVYHEGVISFKLITEFKSRIIYKKTHWGLTYIEVLHAHLELALNNSKEINRSTFEHLGLIWNDQLMVLFNNWSSSKESLADGVSSIDEYIVCENGRQPAPNTTWLYTCKGQLFLEVTPIYRWLYQKELSQDCLLYEQFRSIYKPIFVVPIDQRYAIKLLKELKQILATAQANARAWEIKVNADNEEDCSQ